VLWFKNFAVHKTPVVLQTEDNFLHREPPFPSAPFCDMLRRSQAAVHTTE
jgi:hypothetical protein